jgi:hypothetical protein
LREVRSQGDLNRDREVNEVTEILVDPALYAAYLVGVVAAGVYLAARTRRTWRSEIRRLRDALRLSGRTGEANSPNSAAPPGEFQEQVLALIPVTVAAVAGRPRLPNKDRRLWMCFLSDGGVQEPRLLFVSGRTGDCAELPTVELTGVRLREAGRRRGHLLRMVTREGVVQLLIGRVDDVVRVVNLTIWRGIPLRYQSPGGPA